MEWLAAVPSRRGEAGERASGRKARGKGGMSGRGVSRRLSARESGLNAMGCGQPTRDSSGWLAGCVVSGEVRWIGGREGRVWSGLVEAADR